MSGSADAGWRFAARDQEGRRLAGIVQAATESEARQILAEQKLVPISVQAVEQGPVLRMRSSVNPEALTVFTRQFATLVDASLPILGALEMLAELSDDRVLKDALRQVSKDVYGGSSLSDALRAHPHVFGPIYVHMVQSGEIGGKLPAALMRIADYMEGAQELRERLKGAMVYPAVVLSVALVAIGVILTFVVPIFTKLFASEHLALPVSTRVLVAASQTMVSYWYVIVAVVATLALLIRQVLMSEGGKRWVDFTLLRLPFVGDLTRKASVSRLTRAMASMLHSGVPLSEVLLAAARVAGNSEIEEAVMDARDAIHAGSTLSTPLANSLVLPKLLAQMVQVGEESGRLEEMLDKVADFFEMEVKVAVDRAMKALEPVLIVGLGLVLGAIIVSMYLPIFDLMTSLG